MDKEPKYISHLVISKELHARLKAYCVKHGLVMKSLVEKLIKEFLK